MRVRLIAIAVVAMVAAGCGGSEPAGDPPARKVGELTAQRPLTLTDPRLTAAAAQATYLRYLSTAPDGSLVEVSGAVFLPKGKVPEKGWPVVAFAHGTSGVDTRCAPTDSPDLFASADLVAQALDEHAAVVMANYQGLDGPGGSPYLDGAALGYDVLDSVRAAHWTGLPLAEPTVLFGVSQGGRAAQAASETAKDYAPEMNIAGTILINPALRVDVGPAIQAGTLSHDQYLILPYILAGLRYRHPDYTDDRVLHGNLLAAAPRLAALCTGQMTATDSAVGSTATPDQVRFADDTARAIFTDYLADTDLPRRATTVPTLILRGDHDVLVNTAWSTAAVAEMCRLGIPVRDDVLPGDHGGFTEGTDRWKPWLADRFAARPAPAPTC
ncbi:lipase family protein [Nocardia pseudobrasiliensis]|uniref:Secretory lipase n=1 Tax=Nocardia pseudobrasiliensis TaxID=45979 RepID=A0A370HPN7_9NOCA|nr:lipase family protein [Nocardia pseudobrasiliensis]RDI60427.1 secretory lipase [Nocardia pseudobrasiliensis]